MGLMLAAVNAPEARWQERELRAVFTNEILGPVAKSEALIEMVVILLLHQSLTLGPTRIFSNMPRT